MTLKIQNLGNLGLSQSVLQKPVLQHLLRVFLEYASCNLGIMKINKSQKKINKSIKPVILANFLLYNVMHADPSFLLPAWPYGKIIVNIGIKKIDGSETLKMTNKFT